jgi:hypothetical protein
MGIKLTAIQTKPDRIQRWYWEIIASINNPLFVEGREFLLKNEIPIENTLSECELIQTTVYEFDDEDVYNEMVKLWRPEGVEKTDREIWEEKFGITTSFTIEEYDKDTRMLEREKSVKADENIPWDRF